MRILFCLSGEMRGFPDAVQSLLEKVINPMIVGGCYAELIAIVRLDPWWKAATELPYLRMLHVERNHGPLDDSMILSCTTRTV